MKHFNKLTPAEAERLAYLMEECGEVIQIVGKILRHGYESKHPDGGFTNREQLEFELGDVMYAHRLMVKAKDVDGNASSFYAANKSDELQKYFHHQKEK